MSRKIELGKRRTQALQDVLDDEKAFETLEFELEGVQFETVERIGALVGQNIARIGDDAYSDAQQFDAMIYATQHLLRKEDRKKFIKVLEDNDITQQGLLDLLATLMEEITSAPLDSSSSDGTTSPETSTNTEEEL